MGGRDAGRRKVEIDGQGELCWGPRHVLGCGARLLVARGDRMICWGQLCPPSLAGLDPSCFAPEGLETELQGQRWQGSGGWASVLSPQGVPGPARPPPPSVTALPSSEAFFFPPARGGHLRHIRCWFPKESPLNDLGNGSGLCSLFLETAKTT